MKFYSVETIVMTDGTSTQAIWEKASENEAISSCAMAMGSALINENVATVSFEAKDNLGKRYFEFNKELKPIEE